MDQLYYNANIYSIDKDNRQYSALGVKNGRIVFLGNDEEAARITAEKRIDLGGKTVLPGFIDSHLHMLNYAFVSSSYKMFDVDSIEAVIEEGKRLVGELDGQDAQNAQNGQDVKDAQNTQKPQDASKWLYGRGWNNQKFSGEKRLLTRQDLDRISTTHPIFFIRVCGHAAAINSKALEIVLQTKNAKHYMDQIDTEKGILTEAAVKLCYNAMNAPSVAQIKEMIISAQKDLNRCGITSVQSDNFLSLPGRDRKSIVRAYEELDREGRLTVRVREQASFTSFEEMKEFIDEGYRTGQGSDFYRIGPVKLYEDGSLGAETALLNQPYNSAPHTCGVMLHTAEDLQNCVDYAYKNEMQILIHSIGDRSSDMVCTAYENAIEAYGKKDRRLAINHLQVVSADLFDRMKKSDILAFIQPVFVASDKYVIREWIGEEREKWSYRWKTMMDKGLMCCGGSDSPVERFDVLEGIQVAVTRDGLDEMTQGWYPQQKLSLLQALKLFTINNAYGAFEEEDKGSLELGKMADLVVLDSDPFQVETHHIADVAVLRTIVNGKDVYLS